MNNGVQLLTFDLGGDTDFLLALMREAVQAGFPDWEPDAAYYERMRTRLNLTLNNGGEVLMLGESGRPVAITWYELLRYPHDFDGDHEPEMWPDLSGLMGAQFRLTAVVPNARRRGLGRQLKILAEARAGERGARFAYARCAKRNVPILELNRDLGYEVVPEAGSFHRLRKFL